MILEEETYEAFGYLPSKLSRKNNKLILAACEYCGEFRITNKHNYRTFCQSCSMLLGERQKGENNPNYGKYCEKSPTFGRCRTDEEKALISAGRKGKYRGENNPFFGKYHSEETLSGISAAAKERIGEKNSHYRGGKAASESRRKAKRKRELGFQMLLPLKGDNEVWHHLTNEYVIGIPKSVHGKLGGSRQNHRAKVLEWLKLNDMRKYEMVLRVLAKESLPV